MSLIRENKPKKLFQYFREHGYKLSNPYSGIYYVESRVLFPTQIIVTRELDIKKHVWLRALSEELEKQEMKVILENVSQLMSKEEREFADSVLEVSIRANLQVVEELRGDGIMCKALMEIMEPQIQIIKQEVRKEGLEEGRKEGILGTVKVLRNLGQSSVEIRLILMEIYGLSEVEAEGYL
ncbi:MAG: hypothetical protein NC307_05190 [Roseburia sp.]|nr:hypothetical protein [Roseburia sp.]